MAKKNNNNGVENKNKNNDINNNDGGEKKEDGPIASKVVKSFQGAESVKSEGQANKLTVVGKVDPTKLRDELATKTKKDNKVNKDDANDTKKKQPEKTDDEKPKEDPLNLKNSIFSNSNSIVIMVQKKLSKTKGRYSVSGHDGNDGNDGNSGGRGDEKKKKEDEGNGGGKMKYPAGQSRFGQFSYGKRCRHPYGYQNGALKMGEKMLLLFCVVFGLLVMYN